MGFQEGNQYGKLSKRDQNKLTTEVKEKLTALIDNIIDDIDVEMMTTTQKMKLLDMCLQYSIPKMVYKAEVQQKANKLENVRVQVIDSNGKTISDNLDEKNAGLLQDMHNIIWKD
jgi:hypothetical protein|tara:strand:- start:256 stop:600 length:345 start_codon:yes stop_codon:yes gene_type:complete